ncbi:hypothetical protein JAAARDRAFT_200800 [Jaapia argillacea MUCL 33604]|uniref:Uncharacterized protein n=1 Tax=Jaapia argillacea MUCL 33604 TaxID=933084 RepID=A0A067PGC5_9AGAM|nr:hypothetical protein JAAARDRAFT_200800 [Jaapia argillacea MUCL 33604]
MVMALIAPELVIIWAMRQWFVAVRIATAYQGAKFHLSVAASLSDTTSSAREWTRTHGFFTQMGGFMLVDDEGKPLRPLVLDDLVKLDDSEFPRIKESDIQDKSKLDALSKALIVVQTTWFILQCVARVLEQLPVTELEIATLF